MLRTRFAAFLLGCAVIAPAIATASATAAPASESSSAVSVVSNSSVTSKGAFKHTERRSVPQVTCNGQTFDYGGVTIGVGPRASFYVGTRDGKIRMAKVYMNDGSNANLGMGVVSYSGATVFDWVWGSSRCVIFPGSSQGVDVKVKQDGQLWVYKPRW